MRKPAEDSCSNFKEIKFLIDNGDPCLGLVYVSTGVGEFLAKLDLTAGINWNFSKNNLYNPSLKFNGMVFLYSQILSDYESGRMVDSNLFDSRLNQVKDKILRLYKNRVAGKESKVDSFEPEFVNDITAQYVEILQGMVVRSGASYKRMAIPQEEAIKGRLEYVGGILDVNSNAYQVVGLMGNYYDFSVYKMID